MPDLPALASPPALLAGLALLAVVILVGRFVLKVAWRLVTIAILAVGGLWLLGVLSTGSLGF